MDIFVVKIVNLKQEDVSKILAVMRNVTTCLESS